MRIENFSQPIAPLAEVQGVTVLPDGRTSPETLTVHTQHTVAVTVDDAPWLSIECTPVLLCELVLGRLLSEGRIATAADVECLALSEDGAKARVTLAADSGQKAAASQPAPAFSPADIFALETALAAGYPLYSATHGCHSCTVLYAGKPLCVCEDLSRHNAVDKALGSILAAGLKPADCILYSSGRAPFDMVEKVVNAGVRVFVSKAVPTAQSVVLAREKGLVLVCCARGGKYTVFSPAP